MLFSQNTMLTMKMFCRRVNFPNEPLDAKVYIILQGIDGPGILAKARAPAMYSVANKEIRCSIDILSYT